MTKLKTTSDEAIENYLLTRSLSEMIQAGEEGISAVPKVLKGAIQRRAWENIFCTPTKQLVKFDSILDWIRAKPPEGLDCTEDLVEALIKSSQDAEALNLFRRLVLEAKPAVADRPGPANKVDPTEVMKLRSQGLTQNEVAKALKISQQRVAQIEADDNTSISDIITNTSISPRTKARGTSSDYHDRRLKKVAPELVSEVGAGKRFKTARAALVHAGAITQPIQIVPTDPKRFAEALRKKLPDEFLAQVIGILTELMTNDRGDNR